ncbi:MAG: hypothetical protein R3E91_05255 [Chlamydiales bacterium]
MNRTSSITCAFPCCPSLKGTQTDLSIRLRITSVVIGILMVLGTLVIIYGISGIPKWAHSISWTAFSIGGLLVFVGGSVKSVKPSPNAFITKDNKEAERLAVLKRQSAATADLIHEDDASPLEIDVEEAKSKIQKYFLQIKNQETHEEIEFFKERSYGRYFSFKQDPNTLFRIRLVDENDKRSIQHRISNIEHAQEIRQKCGLGLLKIPKFTHFSMEINDLDFPEIKNLIVLAEEKLDIGHPAYEKDNYARSGSKLDLAMYQLTILILENPVYTNVNYWNSPILNNDCDINGNKKIALLDFECWGPADMGKAQLLDLGLFGANTYSLPGVMGCCVSIDQMTMVKNLYLEREREGKLPELQSSEVYGWVNSLSDAEESKIEEFNQIDILKQQLKPWKERSAATAYLIREDDAHPLEIDEEAAKSKIKKYFSQIKNQETHEEIKFFQGQLDGRYFSFKEDPKILFKIRLVDENDKRSIQHRISNIKRAQEIREKCELGLLKIPKFTHFSMEIEGDPEIKNLIVLAEEKLDVSHPAYEKDNYARSSSELDLAMYQLTVLNLEDPVYTDVNYSNSPILNNDCDVNGNKKIALLDFECLEPADMEKAQLLDLGLFGTKSDRVLGIMRCCVSIDQVTMVKNLYLERKREGKLPKLQSPELYRWVNSLLDAERSKMEECKHDKRLLEHYQKYKIITGREAITIDIKHCDSYPGISNYIEYIEVMVKGINQWITRDAPPLPVPDFPSFYMKKNHRTYHFNIEYSPWKDHELQTILVDSELSNILKFLCDEGAILSYTQLGNSRHKSKVIRIHL